MPKKRKKKCLSEEKEMPIHPKLNNEPTELGIHTLPLNFYPNKLYPNELL